MAYKIVSLRSTDHVEDVFSGVQLETVAKQRYTEDELITHATGADGLFVHSENQYTAALFERVPSLRVIGRPGSGLDNIDLEAATEHDVAVVYTPGMNAVAVAEFVVGTLITHLRSVPAASQHLRDGGWRSPEWWGTELRGKTIGIVGLGDAGFETARRLQVFGVDLLVVDPYVDEDRIEAIGATKVELEDALRSSDVVSLHVRLTSETKHLIDESRLKQMKQDAVLINTARGAVVDFDALADAIAANHIGGAILDVFPEEPPDVAHELFELPTVSVTPHLAGATVETRVNMLETTAKNVLSVLEGDPVDSAYVANPAVFDDAR
jgi:D-3-phosphoglycerate dehydrogenase / 2-oxoglutarate reductase